MTILYLGDIYAEAGLQTVERLLPELKKRYSPDCIVAQAENVSQGRSMTIPDMRQLQKLGIDFFTGGNWTPYRKELHPLLANDHEPVLSPCNYSPAFGKGYKFYQVGDNKILFMSVLGQLVGRQRAEISNPLLALDEILATTKKDKPQAIIVNFHGDFSSEKRTIGYYLDGRVSLVVGDHWHIQTADAAVLPKGTAHISDVGMCGSLSSSLGVSFESIVPRWRDNQQTKNIPSDSKPWQLNGVLVKLDGFSATSIETIRQIID